MNPDNSQVAENNSQNDKKEEIKEEPVDKGAEVKPKEEVDDVEFEELEKKLNQDGAEFANIKIDKNGLISFQDDSKPEIEE